MVDFPREFPQPAGISIHDHPHYNGGDLFYRNLPFHALRKINPKDRAQTNLIPPVLTPPEGLPRERRLHSLLEGLRIS